MDSAAVTGAFALGGVIIGSVVNAAMTQRVAREAQRRAAMTAARLLLVEVSDAGFWIDHALRQHGTWSALQDGIRHGDWDEHRRTLANAMSPDEWATAWGGEQALRKVLSTASEQPIGGAVREADRKMLKGARSTLTALANMLIDVSIHGPRGSRPIREAIRPWRRRYFQIRRRGTRRGGWPDWWSDE